MKLAEYVLWLVAEECAEVAQRCSKAARFGPDEVMAGQSLDNVQRLSEEVWDLLAVLDIAGDLGLVRLGSEQEKLDRLQAKRMKVARYMGYSLELGTLDQLPGEVQS
jgi:hypothetical protein